MGLLYSSGISAEVSFVLAQFTRLTDRQTDGQADGQTDGNLIVCSAVKTQVYLSQKVKNYWSQIGRNMRHGEPWRLEVLRFR